VIIVGLRSRLLLNSTIQQLIRPIAGEGFAVHVYVSVVDKGSGTNWAPMREAGHEDPALKNLTHAQMRRHFYHMIKEAGGCLMCFDMANSSEKLPSIPRDEVMDKRLWQYLPNTSNVGRNVVRIWKSRERLWQCAVQTEAQTGEKYSLVLWTRDDAYWVDRVAHMKPLLSMAQNEQTLWSKNCKEWNGINDKVMVLGRKAANVLLRAYTSFWKPRPPLESWNSEMYLKALAQAHGIKLRVLKHEDLPTGDGMLIAGPKPICISRFYWCGKDLPADLVFCEEVIQAPPPPSGKESWNSRKHHR